MGCRGNSAPEVVQHFVLFLKLVLTEEQALSLIDSALASSRFLLEPAETGSYLTWGSFQALPTETTPAAPLTTKTLPYKVNTDSYRWHHTRKLWVLDVAFAFNI